MNSKIVYAITFILFCTCVSAQDNFWSLTKCIDIALQNNIEVKIKQLEIKRTQKSQNSVLNRMLPSVNLFGEQRYNFGSTIDPATNGRVSSNIQNDDFYLNAKTNLIDFSAFANAQKDKINIELAKAEKEVIENEYKLQLLESYFEALYAQELLKIQKEQLKQTLFNLDRVTREVAIGSKPQSDFYDIQLSYAEDENRNLQTEQSYAIKKLELFQLINLMDVETNQVVLESFFNETMSTNEFSFYNPKIKKMELLYQSSLKSISLERAANLPTLSAYYGYSTFYYKNIKQTDPNATHFYDQLKDNKSQQVGMQLTVPVFNGFRNNKKISASKIESQKSKLMIQQQKQELDKKITLEQQNKKNYLELQKKLNERQTYAKASLATAQAKFTNGKIEAVLYSSVRNQFLTAEYDLLKNNLQLQYIDLKINLLTSNNL